MGKYNKDYLALQNLWNVCALRYLGTNSRSERLSIVDDFRDTLIDIKTEGEKSIRSNYEKWETDYWVPFCEKKLRRWIESNPFEARIQDNKLQEFQSIKQDFNYMRYRKIMQLIQDSGIGLGQGKDIKTINREGYKGVG